MAPRISRSSFRVRWSEPPEHARLEACYKQLDPSKASIARYGGRTCLTATFKDTQGRDAASISIAQSFPEAVIDTNFAGITVFSAPAQPQLDICAVHGLGGHPVDSFIASGTTSHWLRDFLPTETSFKHARISTYGYTSGLFDSSSDDRMSDWADYLLEAISDLRRSTETTGLPIVFVCHSMGGLVVRRAMERLFYHQTDQKYDGITIRQCAALFLSTPHEGTCRVDFGELMGHVLASTFKLRRDLIQKELRSFNNAAAESKDTWNRIREARCVPPIRCLTESRKTIFASLWGYAVKSAMVLDQSAAGFAGYSADKMPDTDHSQVCKFETRFLQGFEMVLRRLCLLLAELQRKQNLEAPNIIRRNLLFSAQDSCMRKNDVESSQTSISVMRERSLPQLDLAIKVSNQYSHIDRVSKPPPFAGPQDTIRITTEDLYRLEPQVPDCLQSYKIAGLAGKGNARFIRVALTQPIQHLQIRENPCDPLQKGSLAVGPTVSTSKPTIPTKPAVTAGTDADDQ